MKKSLIGLFVVLAMLLGIADVSAEDVAACRQPYWINPEQIGSIVDWVASCPGYHIRLQHYDQNRLFGYNYGVQFAYGLGYVPDLEALVDFIDWYQSHQRSNIRFRIFLTPTTSHHLGIYPPPMENTVFFAETIVAS